jgi:RNA polymerase sigma-70 factor (ECF subfamily)
VSRTQSAVAPTSRQDGIYQEAAAEFGPALNRLATAYEWDPEKRRDLLQEIHFSIWRSFATYDARCSLRTWVYRVAHNTATSYVVRQRRIYASLVGLEDLEDVPGKAETESAYHDRDASERLVRLIQTLKPLDRQVIVAYLEGVDAASIAEITGISPANVAVKIHRIKTLLARRFHSGVGHA